MKIIIPASGSGQRFKSAGYSKFKPLIKVVGSKTVVDYVIDCFDQSDEFIFISSPDTFQVMEDHLKTINGLKYNHVVYSGPKLGPVGAVVGSYRELRTLIDPSDKVIVSYCDYGMEWNYKDFLEFADETKADGIIPCYSGYHPHLENENNVYAACKVDTYNRVYRVEEKYKSKNRNAEKWSAGLYYFSSYNLMQTAFNDLVKSEVKLNGEYYVSLAYNNIVIDKNILTYDKISKFYQFGTPTDFEYVKEKLNMLENLDNDEIQIKNTVILSAGKGERFLNLGFKQPKPFIPLGDSDFVSRITDTFNNVNTDIVYVGSKDHEHFWNGYPVRFVEANKIGAAYSYKQTCSDIKGETLIVPCDLLTKYTTKEFLELKKTADVIIFTVNPTEYAKSNRESFAWVHRGKDNSIEDITIKQLSELTNQTVLIGSFWVKNNEVLLESIKEIFDKEIKTNGEYYLDNAFKNVLNTSLNVKYVNLDKYFSLGTFQEYNENNYWLK